MSLFGQTKRHTPAKSARRSPLPVFSSDPEKKYGLSAPLSPTSSRWFTPIYVPLPNIPRRAPGGGASSEHLLNGSAYGSPRSYHPRRYIKLHLPIPPRLYARLPRLSSPARLALTVIVALGFLFVLLGFRKRGPRHQTWSPPFMDPNTLVLAPEEVGMIWEWEVLSGHYPSLAQAPESIPLPPTLLNPAVPDGLLPSIASPPPVVAHNQKTSTTPRAQVIGTGPERNFISAFDSIDHHPGFPARPTPGTILDLDIVLEKCDFSTDKYVRDCLEFLRIGGGLDNGRRVRRGNYLGQFKQLYYESPEGPRQLEWTPRNPVVREKGLSRTPLSLSSPQPVPGTYDPKVPCDPLHPRLFHMFWAGPFNDKPYMAVMSFLFTQNLGLDKPLSESSDNIRNTCRPQFWVWINPGPAAAVPNPNAKREMFESLATNPWSAPFLNERFRDVVKFRMWNTTEQLDGVDELKDHWRDMPIFNSGGNVYKQQTQAQTTSNVAIPTENQPKLGDVLAEEGEAEKEEKESTAEAATTKKKKDALFEKVGSTSESDYDRLSVILSDMARFVLTYRYGGIYLDADTLFLRDWEELWNYRGHFAYRWSWHKKYNTAVLKLHKGSALGKFLFKSALENKMDFHPMTVTRYLKDAGLEKLLFRVPDALFDPAWLNMEGYQRERPPFPYFPEFSYLFSNDKFVTAAPEPVGYDGFFRGAFSYHFHNFWWLPFDKSRNWPDLGQRFIKGERAIREAQRAAKDAEEKEKIRQTEEAAAAGEGGEEAASGRAGTGTGTAGVVVDSGVTDRDDMDDEIDISWSTVLKRTFEAYVRGERPNMYGEWLEWDR